ncbi:MAG: hypothetical protein U0M66_03030 [Bacilli bacterium]|nr:hypothetical protein [Bacilli bacterium]
MRKTRRNIFIFIIVLIALIAFSYYLFKSGATDKIKGQISRMTAFVRPAKGPDDYPVINSVFNSSGERMVNDDVALTVFVSGKDKITDVSYSFDKKKWFNDVLEAEYGNEASVKIVFKKTMNKTVYVRAQNERGYKSYFYETKVMIDKEKPTINVSSKHNKNIISAKDNFGILKLQYSNDAITWIDEDANNELAVIKEGLGYSYVRAVDVVGNISEIKKIND